jgi:AP-4 complex subunit epsilon-1
MMSGSHLSKEFFDLVKAIGESRSKQEEDKIILAELANLKVKMTGKEVPTKKMREFLIRMIYVEMLGHDASFGHINAVKLAHTKTSLIEKRVGYLAVCLTLHSEHSFMLLLINTIQQDLKSDNYLEVAMALTVVCKLISIDTIPAVLPLIAKLLEHKEGLVKKKAVMALHRFHQLDPSVVNNLQPQIRKTLCDSNISVMGASLILLYDLAQAKPSLYKDLVPDFVSILKQVVERRLPKDYDYHRMPAPWIQLKLLQILAVLGNADKQASEGMYAVLQQCIKAADIGINVGYSIVYESVRTITSIYPDQTLIEDAAMSISRFITSENHNLRYLGVNALAAIVQIDSKYAAEHQMVVIDCLEDPDETLKRKTLDLLYSMTNPQNVVVIVDKLISYLRSTSDVYLRTELVSRINELAEKFAPSNEWFISTMNSVFELGGTLVRSAQAHNLCTLIIEAAQAQVADGNVENDIRVYAVETYLQLLNNNSQLPDLLLQVTAFILGEYGHLSTSMNVHGVINVLEAALDRQYDDAATTKSWILHAIMKLVANSQIVDQDIQHLVSKYQASLYVDLQQRAHEFAELIKSPQLMKAVLPVDSAALDIQVDSKLSFLNGYVDAALKAGAKPYSKPSASSLAATAAESKSNAIHDKNKPAALNFEAYAAPITQQYNEPSPPFLNPATNPTPTAAVNHEADLGTTLKLQGVTRKWGPSGYNEPEAAKPPVNHSALPPATAAYVAATGPTVAAMPSMNSPLAPEPQQAKPKPREALPRQLTEKEKAAQALFAGIGGNTAVNTTSNAQRKPAATAAPTQPRVNQPVQQQQQHQQQAPDILGNMLDQMNINSPQQTAADHHAKRQSVDLMNFAANTTPSNQHPQPQAKHAPSNDILDLFGVSSSSQPMQSGNNNNNSGDLFGFSSHSTAPSSNGGGFLDNFGLDNGSTGAVLGAAAMSPAMHQQLDSLTKSPANDVVLASDEKLQISAFRALGAESTTIALFLSNKSAANIGGLTLTVQLPAGLSISTSSDIQSQSRNGNIPNQQVITLAAIQAKTTATQLITFQCRDASFLASPLSAAGQLNYQGGAAALNFNLTLELPDFIRPAVMSTQQYGAYWKQYNEESKVSIRPSTVSSCEDFKQRISGILHIHPVQTIGQENITAGKLVGPPVSGGVGLFVFIHGKVAAAGGQVDCIVRSKLPALSQATAKYLQTLCK